MSLESRADLRAARIECAMLNAWRGKGVRPVEPADLYPNLKAPQKRLTLEQLFASFQVHAAAVQNGNNR